MNKQKKQNGIVYMCLILLLVTASVLVAVASGAGKRTGSVNLPPAVTEDTKMDSAEPERTEKPEETKNPPKTESETTTPRESEKESEEVAATEAPVEVELTVDDIVFTSPVSGSVLVPCSAVPIYSLTMNDYRVHEGVDITAEVGDGVKACANGVVAEVWDDPMMGRSVRLTHGAGVESVYQNLSGETSEGIEVGASVSAGTLLGAVGDTALIECEEEPHLHFEIKVDGVDTDPTKFIAIPTLSEEFEGLV